MTKRTAIDIASRIRRVELMIAHAENDGLQKTLSDTVEISEFWKRLNAVDTAIDAVIAKYEIVPTRKFADIIDDVDTRFIKDERR